MCPHGGKIRQKKKEKPQERKIDNIEPIAQFVYFLRCLEAIRNPYKSYSNEKYMLYERIKTLNDRNTLKKELSSV